MVLKTSWLFWQWLWLRWYISYFWLQISVVWIQTSSKYFLPIVYLKRDNKNEKKRPGLALWQLTLLDDSYSGESVRDTDTGCDEGQPHDGVRDAESEADYGDHPDHDVGVERNPGDGNLEKTKVDQKGGMAATIKTVMGSKLAVDENLTVVPCSMSRLA